MLELDVLLLRFVERDYPEATPETQAAFARLLKLPDPEILDLITGRHQADDPPLRDVIQRLLRTH